jgi:hypothetical protein
MSQLQQMHAAPVSTNWFDTPGKRREMSLLGVTLFL